MEGFAGKIAAFACGAALLYVVVMRTIRKRQQESLDTEASEAMAKAADKAA